MEYVIKPEEHEIREARNMVQQAIEASKPVMPKERNLSVGIGWGKRFEAAVMDPEKMGVKFNTEEAGWKQQLKFAVVQGYAQSWFMEHREPDLHWQELLMLGHSLVFAENITGKKPEVNDRDEIAENWNRIKEEMSDMLDEPSPEMMRFGFSTAYYIGKELEKDHDLEEFIELKRSKVIEAGDRVFGK